MMVNIVRAAPLQFSKFVVSLQFVRIVVIPIVMSIIALHYLFEPGFIGFVDYDGLAPTLDRYLRVASGPWGFWYAPGASIPLVANLILNDSVVALKVAVFVYQYLAFLVAYKALQVIRNLTGHEKRRMSDWLIFSLAIGYAFNIYVIGGLFNYFLPQFQTPYIFAPLYFAFIARLYSKISFSGELENSWLLGDTAKISVTGVFLASSPPMIVMSLIVLTVLSLSIIIGTKRHSLVMKSIILFSLIFLASNAYAIYDIFILPSDDPSKMRFMEGNKPALNGPDLINVLTDSYPSRNTNPRIYPESIFIPSTLFVYLPIVVLFYLSPIIVPGSILFAKKFVLSLVVSAVFIMILINGNANDNSLSNLLNIFTDYIPKFVFSAFINELVNLQHLFSLIFIAASTAILFMAKTMSNIRLLVLLPLIVMPIVANYFYVQSTYFSKVINPSPVPAYYTDVFRFVDEHEDGAYLWLPHHGILEWRGVFMTDIPGFLSKYHEIDFKYVKAFTTDEQYAKIVSSLKDRKFPTELLVANDVKYVIMSTDQVAGYQRNADLAADFIRNDSSNFELLHTFGDVLIYEVKYDSIQVPSNLVS